MPERSDETIDLAGRSDADRHERETIPPSGSASELAAILDRYVAELQAGQAPDRGELLAAHPELAAELEACLAGIDFVHRAAHTGPAAGEPASLGEFRILRELGRGGMGVVYEAEQTSLHRRVALKVLRLGVGPDDEAMQRFRREAETVARLHHTNIVPIFAVGCERGVHYYAMQLIEGRSLADSLDEARQSGRRLAVDDLLRWFLQAAEALTHAHQRGVIHRDIKPSNLLLDVDGVVWLTDFGLARRADEVTLTASGALMGTPRYMSPEQAESLHRSIDHRTDIYSLGASLYEMATGRPAFDSSTPHGVVIQILTEEPARPRQIRPDLPRDLETIVQTCLAKDPSQRYQTAQSLADDLRALGEGRPIRARRVPFVERCVRYVRKRKQSLGRGSIVAAATVALVVGAFLGWRHYEDWRSGEVVLRTDGAPLRAQVLTESNDERVGEPFDVGTRTPRRLPAGDYRLRLTGHGLLGQTYRLGIHRGESRPYSLSLDGDRLLRSDPIPYRLTTAALTLEPGKADFVDWDGETLIRRDGATGRVVWDLARPAKPSDPRSDPLAWLRRLTYHGDASWPGVLVAPAPDLDGDGTGDVVWGSRGTPSMLALSGKDGSFLWEYTASADGLGGPDPHGPAWPENVEQIPRFGRVLGLPLQSDVDGDRTPDVVAAFAVLDDTWTGGLRPPGPANRLNPWTTPHPGRRVIAAISGRTGRPIWSYQIDPKPTSVPFDPFDRGVALRKGRRGSTVCFMEGNRCLALDAASGRARAGEPINLGFAPERPVEFADLDGDGAPDLLALGNPAGTGTQELVAISLTTGKRLWNVPVGIPFDYPHPPLIMSWPLAADLDGDGRAEVFVPEIAHTDSRAFGGVRMLDGATGSKRWFHAMRPQTQAKDGLEHLIVAPDLDGDGMRDVVAVSRYNGRYPFRMNSGEPHRIYVDALSGKDGRSLWWWSTDVQTSYDPASLLVWPPFWWARGDDGWPMLALPLGGRLKGDTGRAAGTGQEEPPRIHLLSGSRGRELHSLEGLSWPESADLDGDGLDDLWGSVDGKLRAFRAPGPVGWRMLGRFDGAGDLDGDGIGDVLTRPSDEIASNSPMVEARSGRDGHLLWQTRAAWDSSIADRMTLGIHRIATEPLPGGDVDADGTADVLVWREIRFFPVGVGPLATLSLMALSGRTGRRLWSAGSLPVGFDATGYSDIEQLDVRSIRPGEPADLIVLHGSPFARPGSVPPGTVYRQTRLARVSGRDGRIAWDSPLFERKGTPMPRMLNLPRTFGDLDGDGSLDLVAMVQVDGTTFELRAISLADGRALWSRPARFHPHPFPALDTGDGDGRAEVLVRTPLDGDPRGNVEVAALDGRDGSARWTWRGGRDSLRDKRDFCTADLDGKGRRSVCLIVRSSVDSRRIVVLDADGRERVGRDLKFGMPSRILAADLDGDGRDELLFLEGDRLHAVRGDLSDLWAQSSREGVERVIAAASGQPSVVVTEAMIGLDGATGRPLWTGAGPGKLIDPGGTAGPARVLEVDGDTTVVRTAIAIGEDGSLSSSGTTLASPDDARLADPRKLRPLPWTRPGESLAVGSLLIGMLAFVTIVVPLATVRLAARRGYWSVRVLMALPVAVAIPLGLYLSLSSLSPLAPASSPKNPVLFVLLCVLGLPVLEYAARIVSCAVRRRWKSLAMIGLAMVIATAIVAGISLWGDRPAPAEFERYDATGWYLVILIGAYAVGGLLLVGGLLRWMGRMAARGWRHSLAR